VIDGEGEWSRACVFWEPSTAKVPSITVCVYVGGGEGGCVWVCGCVGVGVCAYTHVCMCVYVCTCMCGCVHVSIEQLFPRAGKPHSHNWKNCRYHVH